MNPDQQLREPRSAADCIAFLAKTDLFSDLSRSDVESLAQNMEVRTLAQGQFLIRQDEPGDSLYAVFGGRLQVTNETPAGRRFRSTSSVRE